MRHGRNDLIQTFDLQKIFSARLLPRVDPSHVLVVAARRCVGTSRREAADAVYGGAGMMTAMMTAHGRDLLGALAWLAQTACAALLTC